MKKRASTIERVTKETNIKLSLNIDGEGKGQVKSGIGFFDHMLQSFAKHGFFDLDLNCDGDLFVDAHHSVEDCGIVLGEAIKDALGDKAGIKRYGYFILPMDESLVLCSLDLSGRPYLNFDVTYSKEMVGEFDTELVEEFFHAVSYTAGMNLHIKLLDGKNNHHIIEGIFKAFAKALDEATSIDPRITGVLSTKGTLS
ncbi:MAG: imidazoleglycerol-phosphate dehydratase HisB [Lachnospiraceae bacterium]|nr:imidazoleglycerol-phosphate dehydratase HisB [Lachnospiraceae bacterium]